MFFYVSIILIDVYLYVNNLWLLIFVVFYFLFSYFLTGKISDMDDTPPICQPVYPDRQRAKTVPSQVQPCEMG